MKRRHRRRYGQTRLAGNAIRWEALKPLVAFIVVAIVLLVFGSWLLDRFSSSGATRTAAVLLELEERGTVQVSLDGADWQRGEDMLKLYSGDRIVTGENTTTNLHLFDGSMVRLEQNTQIQIAESEEGETASHLSLHVEKGTVWIRTPGTKSSSGTINRFVTTTAFKASIPANAELIVQEKSLTVFRGEGIGSSVNVAGRSDAIIVGEGQSLYLPPQGEYEQDLYSYRNPIDARIIPTEFLAESRAKAGTASSAILLPGSGEELGGDTSDEQTDLLSVTTPNDQDIIESTTVEVSGRVNSDVYSVRINGYGAKPQGAQSTFSLELALPEQEEIIITIEALAEDGEVLAKERRTIYRKISPPEPAHFTYPVEDGGTYQTQSGKLELQGTAPKDAVGIIVNDYRLQFFQPGDATWKYLANIDYDNLQKGENIFTAVAINKAGYKSEPVSITIIVGGETEGVVEEGDTGEEDKDAEEEVIDFSTLPNNAPLSPGSLQVSNPSPGTVHNAGKDETELLIEGVAPSGSQSIWVNDYKLRLFEPAKGLWNYIASTQLGTMSRGANTYTITARNAENMIIDQLVYTINFDPRGE